MKKLFLDDMRKAPDNTWDVVRSYDEFTQYIEKNGVPDIISFDHDLGLEHYPIFEENPSAMTIPYETYKEKTGYHCAQWLIQRGILPSKYFVHSMNPVGKKNIEFIMSAAYKHTNQEHAAN